METQRQTLFSLTQEVIAEAERQMLGVAHTKQTWGRIRRRIQFPFLFLWVGLYETLLSIKWLEYILVLLSFLFLTFFFLPLRGDLPIEVHTYGPNSILLVIFLLFLLVLFAVPGEFAFDSSQPAHIESLANSIEKLGFKTEATIKALENSLQIVADRAASRTRSVGAFCEI